VSIAVKQVKAKDTSPQAFAACMRRIYRKIRPGQASTPRAWHEEAEDEVCLLLRRLGYGEAVDLFVSRSRWYENERGRADE
jgi:hypothetical protein